MPGTQIDPIVPIDPQNYVIEDIVSVLKKMHSDYGLRRFLLVAPGLGVRLTGFPDSEVYRQFGEFLAGIKEAVADRNIQVGWWCAPTLKSGKADFQRITGLNGSITPISSCPLDTRYSETFVRNIKLVAEIARPFIIQFEDDFEYSNQNPVRFGCFCPLHLSEFARRTGTDYTREQLADIFSSVTDQSRQLRTMWAEMSRDTLADFARLIRQGIDEVSPDTRCSLCQSGVSGFDGDFTKAVASAFAGKTRPLVRVYGSTYCSDNSWEIPYAAFNVLYSKNTLPEDFELIHESDSYPHTRFFMSSAKLKSLMSAAFSYGMEDSLFYSTQYLDDPLEESGYNNMLNAERKRFSAIRNELKDYHTAGCQICHSPWSHVVVPYNPAISENPGDSFNPWLGVLGKFGIPYTVRESKVKMLAGNYAAFMSDDEVREMLSGGVMMDGEAAYILFQRGFGDLIGADVQLGEKAEFCSENIAAPACFTGIKGQSMYNFIFAPAGSEGGSFYQLLPDSEAKTLTSFCGPDGNAVQAGMTRYENSLGGRIAITAFKLDNNLSSTVFNYRKKEIIRQTIEWLGREQLPVYVKNLPNTYCIFNLSKTGNTAISTLINLCSDPASEIELALSDVWDGAGVYVLDTEGEWADCAANVVNGRIKMQVDFKYMEPLYMKFTR